MYYPKSHITPNLYSNGELSIKDSNSSYTGYYFKTLDGKAFSGRFPGDGVNQELTTSFDSGYSNTESFEANRIEDTRYYPANSDYSSLNNVVVREGLTDVPTPFYPQPSEQDYSRGEFTRYFAKKTNENIYTEVSGLFQNSLYIGIKLPWLIAGDKDEVYNTNKNIVELREQENQIKGLGHFLRFNYLKFYK